jgi:hypothetical protein
MRELLAEVLVGLGLVVEEEKEVIEVELVYNSM